VTGKSNKESESRVNKGYSPEQIIRKLRKAEVFIAEGIAAVEAAHAIGVTEQNYYR
jgi:putative transposase